MRPRCVFCGSTAGPFMQTDWLVRLAICVGCQRRSRPPDQDDQPLEVLPSHDDAKPSDA